MFDNRQILVRSYKLFDLLVMIFSFALATWITFHDQAAEFSFGDFLAMRIKVQNFVLFIGLIFGWQFIFSAFGLYHSKRLSGRKKEIIDLLKATTLSALLLYLSAWLFNMSLITPFFLFIFWASSSMICISSRYILRRFLEWLRLKGRNLRFVLIVGTNERARDLPRESRQSRNLDIASSVLLMKLGTEMEIWTSSTGKSYRISKVLPLL
jgi:FlaA1/EpsC-like NDP-sugar epimerase